MTFCQTWSKDVRNCAALAQKTRLRWFDKQIKYREWTSREDGEAKCASAVMLASPWQQMEGRSRRRWGGLHNCYCNTHKFTENWIRLCVDNQGCGLTACYGSSGWEAEGDQSIIIILPLRSRLLKKSQIKEASLSTERKISSFTAKCVSAQTLTPSSASFICFVGPQRLA